MENAKKALIVDDMDTVICQISVFLKKCNTNSVSAKNIDDAINHFQNEYFDFVIMDLCMPQKENGLYLLTELKKLIISGKLNTKVIVMSGSCADNVINECIQNGADNYIEKDEDWLNKLLDIIR